MASFRKLLAVNLAVLICSTICFSSIVQADDPEKPKSVILFIGDGMGANHVKASEIYAKRILNKDLAMSSIKTSGRTTTHSASAPITDSAAAATAIYTGFKVKNGQLNVLPDGTHTQGIGMAAKKAGLSIGLVSTARMTDATPAAIYAVSESRGSHEDIALQLSEFNADAVLGVGKRHFLPVDTKNGSRKDSLDIIAKMKENGYHYVDNLNELKEVKPATTEKLFGMFSDGEMPYALDRKHNVSGASLPTLADMTRAAISIVEKNPKGFFLMVEGGRIDHASHANDIRTMIEETLEFDDAIAVGLDFQKSHPDVLIVVTADHETGGLKLSGEGEFSLEPGGISKIRNSLTHVEDKIGKHVEKQESILKEAGLDLTPEELEILKTGQIKAQEEKEKTEGRTPQQDRASKYDSTGSLRALSAITSQRAKVEWLSNNHTDRPVVTLAIGPGARLFEGNYDNTDIAVKIARLLNLSIPRLLNDRSGKKSGLFLHLKRAA